MVLSLLFALTLPALAQQKTLSSSDVVLPAPGVTPDPVPVEPPADIIPVPEPSTLALLVAGMPCFFLAHFTSCDIAFVLLTNF